MAKTMSERLRVAPGAPVDLTAIDPRSTPGAPGDKTATLAALEETAPELAALQERLYAEGAGGGERRLLLILQGMDTSGKGGTIEHVVGRMSPLGVRIHAFKKPTEQERAHHFLWRIRRELPAPGFVGIFDRSHYEDVLIARVRALAEPEVIERRYAEIERFERKLAADGFTVVKCMLHISAAEQRERLLARLDRPEKRWKFAVGDLDERELWDDYRSAYEIALQRCGTDAAAWHVVPADRKWFRNWAVQQLVLEALRGIDPQFPAREDLDVPALRARLQAM